MPNTDTTAKIDTTNWVTHDTHLHAPDDWRGHSLVALLGDSTSDHKWECRHCGDVTACWRTPSRECPGVKS